MAAPDDVGGNGARAQRSDESERRAACVRLARHQIERLRDDLAIQTARQLASLRRRLAAAGQIAADQPERAAAMCRALVDLHQDHAWADQVVAEARRRLDEFAAMKNRQGDSETD